MLAFIQTTLDLLLSGKILCLVINSFRETLRDPCWHMLASVNSLFIYF